MEENLFNKHNSNPNSNHNYNYDLMDTNTDSTQSDFRQTMKSENNRLKTFYINDQCLWPVPGVCPEDLARAGFYYLNDDRVQCAFCTGVISNWTPGMHQIKFPWSLLGPSLVLLLSFLGYGLLHGLDD